jgi:hypothetical protein
VATMIDLLNAPEKLFKSCLVSKSQVALVD